MGKCLRFLIGLCVGQVLISLGAFAQEGALTPRERQLLDAVQKLEQRVADLESQMNAVKAAPPAQGAPAAATNGSPSTSPVPGAEGAPLEQRVAELEKAKADDLRVFWKDGIRMESPDGDFKLRLGGRIFYDMAWFNQDGSLENSLGDEQDGAQFRTGRINLQGDIYKDYFFRLEYDLAGENSPNGFTDTYIGMRNIPYAGRLTLGHFKEPFGLEELTNTSYTTFMEAGLPAAFNPARNLGAMVNNALLGEKGAERMTWALGAFKNTDNFPSTNDSDEDQGWAVTGRITGLPWYADKGRKLFHVGLGYSHRNPDGASINRYQIQPSEARLSAFRWTTTEGFAPFRLQDARVDDVDLIGLESALVYGPFSLQGEYTHSRVQTTFDSTEEFDGYYVLASYFLTGESRAYDPSIGTFGRIRPKEDFSLTGGLGAWELAARYSSVDLNSGGVHGGEQDNITLGVNWYLNPNMRIMLNYIMSDIEHDLYEGDMDILQTRFQIDF